MKLPADWQDRFKLSLLLTISMTLSLGLQLFRIHHTGTPLFLFLIWNLFLAFIPYVISSTLVFLDNRLRSGMLLLAALPLWLLFFPNAPYILTDLFHLKPRAGVPLWFDLVLLLSFAWNGLMLGFLSLKDMQDLLARRFGRVVGWSTALGSLVLGSFGIYLGRYLRWNSWEIFTQPGDLLRDVATRVIYPAAHPRTLGVTLLFSVFLIIAYLTIRQFLQASDRNHHPA